MSTTQIVIVIIALSLGAIGMAFGVTKLVMNHKAGIGPPVRGPRLKTEAGKGRENDYYSSHGWPKPYDEKGHYVLKRQGSSRWQARRSGPRTERRFSALRIDRRGRSRTLGMGRSVLTI